MTEPMAMAFPDLPALAELGDTLAAAFSQAEGAQRRQPRWRRARLPMRSLVVGVALFVVLAASAAAATLLVLRGSVIPGPQPADVQPPMSVRPDSVHLSGVTAGDPRSRSTWTVRVATSRTGLVCLTAGELRDGHFGITGLDRRFRLLAPDFVDGCGAAGTGRAAYVGARVFDSSRRADVRTVVNGFAGPGLRVASLEVGNESKQLRHSPDGVFVGAVAGYPEDVGLSVLLRFADGKTERHDFGHSGFVAPDPGGAMRIMSYTVSGFMDRGCVRMLSAREVRPFASGPTACGKTRSPYYFAVRRLRNGQHGSSGISQWHWNHASRTVVWGYAKKRSVRSVALVGAGKPRRLPISLNGAFQALLPPSVDPARLQVVVRFRNGAMKRGRLSANLVDPPGRHR